MHYSLKYLALSMLLFAATAPSTICMDSGYWWSGNDTTTEQELSSPYHPYFNNAALCPRDVGTTPMHHAYRTSDIEKLLKVGACLDYPDYFGDTPLHYALRYFKPETASALLAFGANVNARNALGRTPLYHVYEATWIRALVERNADIENRDADKITALANACRRPSCIIDDWGIKVARALLEAGANLKEDFSVGMQKYETYNW